MASPAGTILSAFDRMLVSLLVADGFSYTKEDLAHIAIGALIEAGYTIEPPGWPPRTCQTCGEQMTDNPLRLFDGPSEAHDG